MKREARNRRSYKEQEEEIINIKNKFAKLLVFTGSRPDEVN
jgi:hypothetical protein